MTGLDTNVLVRYIMQDDVAQAAVATALLESLTAESPGYVTQVVMVELFWVLTSAYRLTRGQAAQALELLLQSRELRFERGDELKVALRTYKQSSADFPDCLIAQVASAEGCVRVMTFDRNAAKVAGMELLG